MSAREPMHAAEKSTAGEPSLGAAARHRAGMLSWVAELVGKPTLSRAERDSPLDPDALAVALERRVFDVVRPSAAGLVVGFSCLIVFDSVWAPASSVFVMVVHDLVVLLASLWVWILVGRRRIRRSWASAVLGGLSILTLSSTLVSYALLNNSLYTTHLALEILGMSGVMLSTAWLASVGTTALLGWLLISLQRPPTSDLWLEAMTLLTAAALASVVHVTRVASSRRLERLRMIDEVHRRQLEFALESLHRELDDRKQAESEREALREQLLHAQKMEAIGTLAGGIAHDMNNVLGAISGLAELLSEELTSSDPMHDDIEQILVAARRGSELTRNLLGFSRKGKYRRERVRLEDVVAEVEALLGRTLPKGITIHTTLGHCGREVEGDPGQLSQALINLCLNASDAMAGKGPLTIETRLTEVTGDRARLLQVMCGQYLELTVADTGRGMDAETQRRMFEPFFTTKETGKGTGLGLAMVYGTVQNHNGAVQVDTRIGRGTLVHLLLPALPELSSNRISLPRQRIEQGVGGLVLLVDDEAMIRSMGQRFLERLGYRVVLAEHGARALSIFERRRSEIGLVVLDMSMPTMDGVECFRKLRDVDPDVRVLLTSGYARGKDTEALLTEGALGFLDKPYSLESFAEAVSRGMRGERFGGRPVRDSHV